MKYFKPDIFIANHTSSKCGTHFVSHFHNKTSSAQGKLACPTMVLGRNQRKVSLSRCPGVKDLELVAHSSLVPRSRKGTLAFCGSPNQDASWSRDVPGTLTDWRSPKLAGAEGRIQR